MRGRVEAQQGLGAQPVPVPPGVAPLGPPDHGLAQHPVGEGPAGGVHRREQVALQLLDDRGRRPEPLGLAHLDPLPGRDLAPQRRRDLHRVPRLRGQRPQDPFQPRGPDVRDVGGDVRRRALAQHEPVAGRGQDPPIHPVAHELHREHRVACGARSHLLGEGAAEPQEVLDEAPVLGVGQGRDREVHRAVGEQPADLLADRRLRRQGLVAHRRDQQDRARLDLLPAQQVLGEGEGLGPPLHVVDEQEQGPLRRLVLEQPTDDHEPLGRSPQAHGGPGLLEGVDGSHELGGQDRALPGPGSAPAGRHQLRQRLPLPGVGDPAAAQQGLDARADRGARHAVAPQEAGDRGSEPLAGAGHRAVVAAQDRGRAGLVGPTAEPLREPRLSLARAPVQDHDPGPALRVHAPERRPEQVALGHASHQRDAAQAPQTEPCTHQVERALRRLGGAPVGPHGGGLRPHGGGGVARRGDLVQDREGVRRALEPIDGVLLQQDLQPRIEASGHGGRGRELRDRLRRVGEEVVVELAAHERGVAGGEDPRQAADRVEVGPGAEVAGAHLELLGRHVRRAAEDVVGEQRGRVLLAQQLRDPEVRDLDAGAEVVGARHEDVRSLDVPVDHPPGVRVGERLQERPQDGQELGPREVGAEVGEGASTRHLHHEDRRPGHQVTRRGDLGFGGDRAVLEHHHDARVVEPRHCPHLAAERRDELRIARLMPQQDLRRDRDALLDVHPAPHFAHAAAADPLMEQERTQRDGGGGRASHRARGV